MQSRFSVYMDILESKGLGVMKRATRNEFSYKIHEATTFQKREDIAKDGGFRDPNFGDASSKIEDIENKAGGVTAGEDYPDDLVAKAMDNLDIYQDPAVPFTQEQVDRIDAEVQRLKAPEKKQQVTADDLRAYDANQSPEEREAINNNPHKADNDKLVMDPHGKKTDAIMQGKQPVPAPTTPATPVATVEPTAPAPAAPAPAAPAEPTDTQPGMMDKFLSGVNKAGEKLGNFQDRAKAFSQRTGGQGARGDLSKLMKYGMFGQESLDKPAQIENLKQQFIQQGYPEDQAVKMATDTVNKAPVADAEKMDNEELARQGTSQNQTGVQTNTPTQTGVQTNTPTQTGVQTNTPTKTADVLDQATIDTIDPDDIDNLKTIPDNQLDSAVQAVADGNKLDAVALRKFIDAQRAAISPTSQ